MQGVDHAHPDGPVLCRACPHPSLLRAIPDPNHAFAQPEDSKIEVKYLPRGTLQVVETIYGHVGGGGGGSKEDDRVIAEAVRKLLA